MHGQQNAITTYRMLTLNRGDYVCREALEATTSPVLWTVYVIQDGNIINHVIKFSEADMWHYCEKLVRNGLDYEVTTPSTQAVK